MPTRPTMTTGSPNARYLHDKTWDRSNEIVDLVEQWRARVDEVRVQLDLAKLDLRDQAARQLELANDANFAASAKLRDAYRDARTTAEALQKGIEELIDDVKGAFVAVERVLEQED
jgi:hypothetical protein